MMRSSIPKSVERPAARRRSAILGTAFSAIVVIGLSSASQAQSPAAASQAAMPGTGFSDASFVEQVDVRLVEISLLATDRQGTPVPDLGIEDLEVRLGGKTRSAFFLGPMKQGQSSGGEPAVADLARGRIVLADSAQSRAAARLPTSSLTTAPRWKVFAVDVARSEPADVSRAWDAIDAFLRDDFSSTDLVAIATLTETLHLERPFSSDRSALRAAVAKGRTRSVATASRRVRLRQLLLLARDCQRRMTGSGRFAPGAECSIAAAREFVAESAVLSRDFSLSFELLSRVIAGVDGATSIYLFSGGALSRPEDVAAEAIESVAGDNVQIRDLRHDIARDSQNEGWLSEAAQAATEAGAVLFAIDGSRAGGDLSASNRLGLRRTAAPERTAWQQARLDLESVAELTGGMFVGSGDVAADFRAVLKAEQGVYGLGIYLEPGDSEKEEIEVRSQRRGLKLRWSRDSRLLDLRQRDHGNEQPALARLVVESADREPVGGARRQPFRIVFSPEAFSSRAVDAALAFHSTVHLSLEDTAGLGLDHQFRLLSPIVAPGTRPVLSGFLEVDCPQSRCPDLRLRALVRDPTSGEQTYLEADLEAQLEARLEDSLVTH